ncbi:MAG: hypothetical protein E6R13_01505, partial [Spirochaetes bacterium]
MYSTKKDKVKVSSYGYINFLKEQVALGNVDELDTKNFNDTVSQISGDGPGKQLNEIILNKTYANSLNVIKSFRAFGYDLNAIEENVTYTVREIRRTLTQNSFVPITNGQYKGKFFAFDPLIGQVVVIDSIPDKRFVSQSYTKQQGIGMIDLEDTKLVKKNSAVQNSFNILARSNGVLNKDTDKQINIRLSYTINKGGNDVSVLFAPTLLKESKYENSFDSKYYNLLRQAFDNYVQEERRQGNKFVFDLTYQDDNGNNVDFQYKDQKNKEGKSIWKNQNVIGGFRKEASLQNENALQVMKDFLVEKGAKLLDGTTITQDVLNKLESEHEDINITSSDLADLVGPQAFDQNGNSVKGYRKNIDRGFISDTQDTTHGGKSFQDNIPLQNSVTTRFKQILPSRVQVAMNGVEERKAETKPKEKKKITRKTLNESGQYTLDHMEDDSYQIFDNGENSQELFKYDIYEEAKKKFDELTTNISVEDKKAEIERRRQEVERLSNKELTSPIGKINTGKIEIPILPSQNIDKTIYKDNKGVEYKVKANFKNLQDVLLGRNGKYLFRGMQGRFFVLAKVGDFYLPFYISSAGTSGKKQGEWYPFFGYTGNWLVKGRVGNKGEMEYSQKISEVQKLLQENLQFPSRFLNLKGEMKVGDNVIYDINQDFNYIEHFTTFGDGTVKREGDKYPILKETLWIQEITGFDPRKVHNDGEGSADTWINDIIALIENAPLASKGKINAKYDAEYVDALETEKSSDSLTKSEESQDITELDTDLLLEENDLGLPTDDITVDDSEEFKLQISELVDLDLQYEAVESFAYMLLTNKDTALGDNKQWLLNKLKDNLTTFKKYAKFERSPENKAKAEAVVERYNNIIGIYDELYDRAEVFLTELGLKPNTEGYYDTIEETEETINQMVDNAAFKEDREAGASANIRKFLYFIPDVKEDGTNVRNKLGLYNFNDFKATYNIIAFELAGKYYKSDASGKEKMFRLLSDSSSPILKKVAEKIKTESEQTQREFFMLFNQQHITYNTILFSILNEKTFYDKLTGGYTTYGQNVMANIINSDQVQAQQQIVKQWRGVFNTLPIVKQELNKTSGEVNYVIDTEKGKELYDKLESIVKDKTKFNKGKLTNIDEVYDLVSSVIPISKEAFTDFLNYHLDVMGKRGNHVYLLNNNILRPLFTRISGKSKTDSGEDSETSRTNDPFDFESSTVKLLAKYEYLRSKNAHSATLRAGGNQYYSFVRPNPLYRLITQLKGEGGVNQFIADKRSTDVFFNHSYWAENLADVKDTSKEFYDNFELLYEKGSEDKKRKYSFKELSQMTAKEFTLTDFWLFQNGGKAQAKIVLDTMSDKTTKPIQGVLRHEVNVNGSIDAGFTLDEKTLDILYRYFLAEYSRILAVQEQNKNLPESQRIQKYHDIGTKQGMGKYFLIYSFLNFDLAEEGSGVMGMYNEDGTIKEGLDKDEAIKELVKEQINKNFNQIAKALKQDVESLGLVGERTSGKRTYYSPTPLLDKRYYKKLANRLSYLDKSVTDNEAIQIPQVTERKRQIVDLALVEFLVNKAITSNEMLLLTGDPAQHGKPLRESADKAAWLLDSIKETFNNVSKRNARLLASGNTKYWPDSTYYVGMLVDEKVESPYIDEYVKSLKKLGYSEAEVKKEYENGEETNAQELTTVEEHLTDMLSSGEINDEEFKIYLGLWDPEAYTKKYKESPSKPSKEILKKAKNVLQPRKPVQVYGKLDPSLSITKQFYIKTSSFPLIPSVIKGNPIMENLLSQMKSNNVQRVAFPSGVKLGVTSPAKLTVNGKPNPDIFKNNILELDRDGFAIQLEVPY